MANPRLLAPFGALALFVIMWASAFAGGGGGGPATVVTPFTKDHGPTDLFPNRVINHYGQFRPFDGDLSTIVETENHVGDGKYRTDTYDLRGGIRIDHWSNPEPGTVAKQLSPEQGEKLAIVRWEDRRDAGGNPGIDGLMDTLVTQQFRAATPLELELNKLSEELSEEARANGYFLAFYPGNCDLRVDFAPAQPGPYRNTWRAKNSGGTLSAKCADGKSYFIQRVYPGSLIGGTTDFEQFWHRPGLFCDVLRWGTWQPQSRVSDEATRICGVYARSDTTLAAYANRAGFRNSLMMGYPGPIAVLTYEPWGGTNQFARLPQSGHTTTVKWIDPQPGIVGMYRNGNQLVLVTDAGEIPLQWNTWTALIPTEFLSGSGIPTVFYKFTPEQGITFQRGSVN